MENQDVQNPNANTDNVAPSPEVVDAGAGEPVEGAEEPLVPSQAPVMTTSQKYQFLFGLLLMGALFLYQIRTSKFIIVKLRTSRKSIWIFMAFLSGLLLFYLFMMVYGIMHLVVNGFSVLPWWMLLFPTAIEMITTFSLTVLRIMRLRAAFPITPLLFKVLVAILVPLTVMSAVSLVANAVWTAGGIGFEYLLYMSFLHPWNWEVGMMIASILADSAFLAAVSLATARTELMRQKPQLSFKTTLLIILHIILSTFFVAQIFISDSSFGFTIYYISVAAFPIDQRAFFQINNQVQRWFSGRTGVSAGPKSAVDSQALSRSQVLGRDTQATVMVGGGKTKEIA